ncbi:hypothetical protein ABIA65_003667 [Mycolicibacterium sp. 624]
MTLDAWRIVTGNFRIALPIGLKVGHSATMTAVPLFTNMFRTIAT